MNIMERIPPWLVALGVVAAGFVAGGLLVAMDRVLIGVVVAGAAIPIGFAAWVMAADRY
jgi:hypothetical protein